MITIMLAVLAQCGAVEIQSRCWNDGRDAKPWQGYEKGVRWEKSLEAAMKRAAGEKKPVLFFQLVGDLDREGCWAAGDLMRTVTFSEARIAKLVNEEFVPAWTNRGEGFHNEDFSREDWMYQRVMEAYPTKNICTFFLSPDGRVFHYVAGSYAPDVFLRQLRIALELRRVAYDASMALKEGALEETRRLHREAADVWTEKTLGHVPHYRGHVHKHSDSCSKALADGYAYFKKLHAHWAEAKELPALDAVRYKYVYGNSFTEEPPRGGKAVE